MRKIFFIISVVVAISNSDAHDPLYGIGPHVLFKGGFAPHFMFDLSGQEIETDFAIGYGITKNWTAIGEINYQGTKGSYSYQGFHIKQKYRFYSRFKPGMSQQISAVVILNIPYAGNPPTVANIGLTGGQEALRWYWFFSGNYAVKFSSLDYVPGNEFIYTATIGYRPIEADYYKPDLVIFLEGLGKYHEKATFIGEKVMNSSGNNWSIAPTFMLTYKNMAFRSGVNFNIYNNNATFKNDTSFRVIIEYHL